MRHTNTNFTLKIKRIVYIKQKQEFHMDNTTINQVALYKKFFENISDEDFQFVSKQEIVQMLEKIEQSLKQEKE